MGSTHNFIFNNNNKNSNVLYTLKKELLNCDEFYISVAFITFDGINILNEILEELRDNNIKGKIITTDYLYFSDPNALRFLNNFDNIEVRMYEVNEQDYGFHTKGYMFRHGDNLCNLIIGSSNLTKRALTTNKEWNVLTQSNINDDLFKEVISEFNLHWDSSIPLESCLDKYKNIYNSNNLKKNIAPKFKEEPLTPNFMQKMFIKEFLKLIDDGKRKGLLISATGTGKTYASAFAMKKLNSKRILFVVHRERILKQAINSYKEIFDDKSFGLITGNSKDSKEFDKDFIFSTEKMMGKKSIYSKFDKNDFDFIIIDEAHRSGKSYDNIMKYFNPKFFLGMTASPDSNIHNIYGKFDYNIIYEIRLYDALKEDMLCPFHYFGISDLITHDEYMHNKTDFNKLTSDERVKHIIQKSRYFGYSGDRVKGLVFCNTLDVAKELSMKFNEKGFNTIFLSGGDNEKIRDDAIDRLASDSRDDKLDYIFTRDIFNEGIDIPEVNQIIMLRPTNSSIIFIQQLGRGLRKYVNKDYLVVIDFIANYEKNFIIPLALSGDRTGIGDNHIKWLDNKEIPGKSSVSFDKISKNLILNSISKEVKLNSYSNFLKKQYFNLKYKLNRVPLFKDFQDYGDIDPILIMNYLDDSNKDCGPYKTYYNFIKRIDDNCDYIINNSIMLEYLQFITLKLARGRRPHELIILRELYNKYKISINYLNGILFNEFGIEDDFDNIYHAITVLEKQFDIDSEIAKYPNVNFFSLKNDTLVVDNTFRDILQDGTFSTFFIDILEYGIKRYNDEFYEPNSNLKLYGKYNRYDFCYLLNWDRFDSQIRGYKVKNGVCPIFVTYDKNDDISESMKYDDKFLNNKQLIWMSKNDRKVTHSFESKIINHSTNGIKLYLFVKKSDDEGKDFYYLGPVSVNSYEQTERIINGKKSLIVKFVLDLDVPVPQDIYNYLTSKDNL